MAFSPNFVASQVAGSPEDVVLTDTSTGSDAAVTSRIVYFATKDNTFLVPSGTATEYVEWAEADVSETFDILTKDRALRIVVEWLDVDDEVLYTYELLYGFTLYNRTFDYQLTQILAGNPPMINDNKFFLNKVSIQTYMKAGDDALELASDQTLAQICYDEATALRIGSQYYFNANA